MAAAAPRGVGSAPLRRRWHGTPTSGCQARADTRRAACAALACLALFVAPGAASAQATLWIANLQGYGDLTSLYPHMSSTRGNACRAYAADIARDNIRVYSYYAATYGGDRVCPGTVQVLSAEPACVIQASPVYTKAEPSIPCADPSIWPPYNYPVIAVPVAERAISEAKAAGRERDRMCFPGNPINPGNGNKVEEQVDYVGGGLLPLVFARRYNSLGLIPDATIGRRWRHSFDARVVFDEALDQALAYRPDGVMLRFARSGADWVAEPDVADRLERLFDAAGAPSGWRYRVAETDFVETYGADGRLTRIANRAGVALALEYAAHAISGAVLARVVDPGGRALAFTYDALGRIATMTDPAGGLYQYAYHADTGNLVGVTYPDGRARQYHYELTGPLVSGSGFSYASALTGITDERGVRFATYAYDGEGRAVLTEHAGGAGRVELSYAAGAATIIDALGASRAQSFATLFGVPKTLEVSGTPAPDYGPAAQTLDPATGQIAALTDWNGHQTTFVRGDPFGRTDLETARTEAEGTAEARTVATEWHPRFRLPTRIVEPGRETTLDYDVAGNLINHAVRDTATNTTRTWAYTYDALGRVLAADGPRTDLADLTTYAYYADDDPDLGRRGNLRRITNAAGHVTEIAAYDAHGQPTRIVDPNGLITTLAYDARQRLVARDTGGETTAYAYDAAGQLTRVTLPDGRFLDYAYDDAQRLVRIADNVGSRIEYTLDAMGNRLREEAFDASGTLAQTRAHLYNTLNRLAQSTSAFGHVTTYGYDGVANLTAITDPLGREHRRSYDALGRLVAMIDPAGGATRLGYDALDQLRAVTDPRGLATAYERSALGDLAAEQSPDAGATARTFDAAGNVLTRTNANGTSATYTYDALGRVTRIAYSDGQVETFGYDAGANGAGRLTSITDSSGTTTFAYDPHGRLTQETRTIAGIAYLTAYGYDAAGRLTAVTYPSGRVITYGRDALGWIERIETSGAGRTQVLVQDAGYFPFGGLQRFTYGSLAAHVRTIDVDGRIAAYTLGADARTLTFDAASRITGIADPANAANDALYSYDALDRLVAWTQGTTSQGFAYDATGNRTALTLGGTSYPYSVDPASNRLLAVAGPTATSFGYDAAGSLVSSSAGPSFAYDARGRMVRATVGSAVTEYRLNALGQRVAKLVSARSTHYHYDAAGRLIAESDGAGRIENEYVWLGDTPVALIAAAAPASSCPARPELRPLGGFTAFERRERMEVHSGRPGERGWEWGLGENTRDFEASAREDLEWVSGKPYAFRLAYDGAGNAQVTVRDGAAELFTLRWSGGMDVGNALRFVVRSPEDIGAGNLIRVELTNIDGEPVAETLQTAGDNSLSRDARIFAGESLRDGYTVDGTVTFIFRGGYPPRGNKLDFHVTAGNVVCNDTTGGTTTPIEAKVYYIHPDHLDTPRRLTDGQNRVVWKWDSDPFGSYAPEEDPDGDGTKITFNFRFPGQYFDAETGLHQNYFRDYDPAVGRYVQTDPIGLAGGLNTYAYARLNPQTYLDPDGQFAQLLLGVGAAVVLWALPELLLPDPPLPPGSGAVYPATLPDGTSLLKCVAALGVLGKAGRTIREYEVGQFADLARRSRGDSLEIHHAAQKHPARQVIQSYDPKTGPSIALPRGEHREIPTIAGEYARSARELLAKDIRDLRNNTNAPNSALQELIRLNKEMYPSAYAK
jgi:RHS repeat-associated protein